MLERDLRELCDFFKEVSFWMVGVWLLIGLSPIILPFLLVDVYLE